MTKARSAAEIQKSWDSDARWAGIVRRYGAPEVVRLRGSLHIEHSLARRGAERLWRAMGDPAPVRALFAVAGLRLACLDLGIEEVTTVRTRNQVRVKPVDEARGIEAAAALPEAAYHPATRTLNLNYPARLGSEDLAAWVREAVADAEPNRARIA